MLDLNDDLWLLVLELLDFDSLFKAGNVCKRWKIISQNVWKRKKHLNLFEFLYENTNFGRKDVKEKDIALRKILESAGPYLCTLSLAKHDNKENVKEFGNKLELTVESLNLILRNCTNLKSLNLSKHIFPSLKCFEKLVHLNPETFVELELSYCRLDVNSFEEGQVAASIIKAFLSKFNRLKKFCMPGRGSCYGHLILDSDVLQDVSPEMLHLNLSAGQSMKCKTLQFLSNNAQLQTLILQRSKISTEELEKLQYYCPRLVTLDLSYTPSITNFGSISRLKHLSELILDGNRDTLTDQSFIDICNVCPLTNLSIESCASLTNHSFKFISVLKDLNSLNLNGNMKVEDDSLIFILNSCSKLEVLKLKYCRRLTKTSLICLSQTSNLEYLGISGVTSFDDLLLDILINSTKLKVLKAFECPNLSLNHVKSFSYLHVTI